MKNLTRFLLFLNILTELALPLPVFFIAWSGLLTEHIFPPVVTYVILPASVVLSYIPYVHSVYLVNMRRFPRVFSKAWHAWFAPILIELILAVVAIMVGASAALFIPIHFYTAMLLSTVLESVQRERVRTVRWPFLLWFLWMLPVAILVGVFGMVGGALYALEGSGIEKMVLAFLWFFALLSVIHLKYHRPGRQLYAEVGYRPNAAAIVSDGHGHVLLCERADRPGTVQTVQGGIDPGETPEQAAERELMEELGLLEGEYEVKAQLLASVAYQWDLAAQKKLEKSGYVGQQQYFFLVEVSPDVDFDLDYHHREFRKVWWGTPEQMLQLAWSKKRPGIEAALKGFGFIP